MSTKHTPPPWFVAPGHVLVVAAGDGFSVCDCTPGNPIDIPRSQAIANTHLVVASPEMHAILDELEDTFDKQTYDEKVRMDDVPDDYEYCVNITSKQLRAISAALSKAEGRS